ncbi:hypothetical protein [Mesonia mobilis]|uniref:hypothetical protein n=1 Tax=Mesonia mobilis TaxID=369791 RepID=UPI0026EB2CD6|nr:hypothetical protein [Mesonia mobilis]
MKKRYFLFILVLICIHSLAHAQVGVNTTDPQAALDVRATNPTSPSNSDGLLIPRIDAFPASDPTAAQNGMMVFLTTADGIFEPGFYYWDNASTTWNIIGNGGDGATAFWSLDGNAGTDSATNFIGTIDAEDFMIRTNNEERISFDNDRSRINFLNNGNSIFIGALAGNNDDLSTNNNTFVGNSSGQENTSGEGNAAFGYQSLQNNTSGNGNLAFGTQSLNANTTGSNNVALGNQSSQNVTGSTNVSIGYQSFQNGSGSNNIAIGDGALQTSNGVSGNIAIGLNAGSFSTSTFGDNMLYIQKADGAFATGSRYPLILGDFDTGNVGISVDVGVASPLTHTLTVGGDVYASDGFYSTVANAANDVQAYPDYVFESFYEGKSKILPSYKFKSLSEVEGFIKENGHLPGVKSYAEVKENDFKIELGSTSVANLEKIEEAFLYIIQLNHQVEAQEKELEERDAKIEELENRIKRLEKLFSEKH